MPIKLKPSSIAEETLSRFDTPFDIEDRIHGRINRVVVIFAEGSHPGNEGRLLEPGTWLNGVGWKFGLQRKGREKLRSRVFVGRTSQPAQIEIRRTEYFIKDRHVHPAMGAI